MSEEPIRITFEDVLSARELVSEHLPPTPLRNYPVLDEAVGHGIRVLVKHENHQPTNAFKARNGLVALARLSDRERERGVVTATRGNHGQGLAWAARMSGTRATVCVPVGNNPEKNTAMKAFGAELFEHGETYDDALVLAQRLAQERGATLIHSTNDPGVLAGAATIALEVLEQEPEVDAFVISIGGGSQAVGAITVARELRPQAQVFGVQAATAPTIHDSWHAGRRTPRAVAPTLADGLATGDIYEGTFEPLREGLADFITATEDEIAAAIRLLLETTHNLAEGGGAAGLAGLLKLAPRLAGQRVVVFLSGGNIDRAGIRQVLAC